MMGQILPFHGGRKREQAGLRTRREPLAHHISNESLKKAPYFQHIKCFNHVYVIILVISLTYLSQSLRFG